jgi:hypothetical protein
MLAGITIKEARDMGYSIRNVGLDRDQAKILQHYSHGCKGGRTVCVVYDTRGNGAIIAVACAACGLAQHCTTPTPGRTGTSRHGREATTLTPAGWRCLECAADQGFWEEKRDGFAKLVCKG